MAPAVSISSSSVEGTIAQVARFCASMLWDKVGSQTTSFQAETKSNFQEHLPCLSSKPHSGRRAGGEGTPWPPMSMLALPPIPRLYAWS